MLIAATIITHRLEQAEMGGMTKSSSSLRWLILLLASLLMLSNYYNYDIPASLKDLIRQNMGLDKAEYEVIQGHLIILDNDD